MTSKYRSIRALVPMLLAAMVGLLFPVDQAIAGDVDGLRWEVGCNGFTNTGGGFLLDRDNTGQGREEFIIRASDGLGNTIFAPFVDSGEVGTGVYLPPGTTFEWTALPVANPLTVTLTSASGNNLVAETIYTVTGTCDILERLSPSTAQDDDDADDRPEGQAVVDDANLQTLGITSPSVPLNGTPPTATNARDLRGLYPGILIVDAVTANLRSGAGTQFTVVGLVEGSTQLIVLGRDEDRAWWYVQVGDLIGWISSSLVIISGDLTEVPVVPSLGEVYPPRLYIYRDNAIRLSPNARSLVLCTLEGPLEYVITGQNADGSWLRIEAVCNERTVNGWLRESTGAIRNSGDLSIPIVRR